MGLVAAGTYEVVSIAYSSNACRDDPSVAFIASCANSHMLNMMEYGQCMIAPLRKAGSTGACTSANIFKVLEAAFSSR